MRRGEIWWADLGVPFGSEPGYRRPVIIVSSNTFNNSSISTVVIVILTRNLALEVADGNFKLPAGTAGLRQASVVNVSQIMTADRSRLLEFVSRLPDRYLNQLNSGLRLSVALD